MRKLPEPTTKTMLQLTEEERRIARDLGNGSMVAGIRKALRLANDYPFEDEQWRETQGDA